MDGLTSFKNEIFKYGILILAIFELASLPFLGWDAQFFYGLSLGTAVTIVNFNLMTLTLRITLERRNIAISYFGYLIRLALYGVTFYLALKTGLICAVGTLLGFFTLKLAMLYLHGIKAEFSKGRTVREEPEERKPKKHWYDFKENEDDDESYR